MQITIEKCYSISCVFLGMERCVIVGVMVVALCVFVDEWRESTYYCLCWSLDMPGSVS